jgi:hypothetical protein
VEALVWETEDGSFGHGGEEMFGLHFRQFAVPAENACLSCRAGQGFPSAIRRNSCVLIHRLWHPARVETSP